MRTEKELRARLAELEADERLTQYETANVFSNAPLALIQQGGRSQIDTLRWCLGMEPMKVPNDPKLKD